MYVFSGSYAEGWQDLYLADDAGLVVRCLSAGQDFTGVQQVELLPGRRAMFRAQPNGERDHSYYLLDLATMQPRRLAFRRSAGFWPECTVDSERLLLRNGADRFIYHLDDDRIEPIDLPFGTQKYVQFSPDGQVAAIVEDWDLLLWEGGQLRRLDMRAIGVEGIAGWTPDGRDVTLIANYSDLWLVARDGSAPRQFAELAYFHQRHCWSPDGQWLAFYHPLDDGGPNTSHGQIWLRSRDGATDRVLAEINGGAWAWCSERALLLASQRGRSVSFERIDLADGARTPLVMDGPPLRWVMF